MGSVEKKNIIFYGAGRQAQYLLSGKLKGAECPIPKLEEGVCFADADERKYSTPFMGLPIMHITEAIEKWPDANIYVALGYPAKYSVLGYLTDTLKVPADKILNYEPVELYPSCEYLQGYLVIENQHLGMCFDNFGRNKAPYFEPKEDMESAVETFLEERERLIESVKNNDGCSACSGCRDIVKRYWPKKRRIKYINFNDYNGCNIRCSYCTVFRPLNVAKKPDNGMDYRELVKYLGQKDLLDEDLRFKLVAGEITVHPKREEILEAAYPYPAVMCSNALIYDEKIAAMLERGLSYLYVSMDAGTKETFAKIKGADIYEIVCNNLRKYSKCGALELKYIVIPGVNDNETDAEGFFDLCAELSVQNVMISRDFEGWIEIDDNQLNFMLYLYQMFMEAHIPVSIPTWQYSENENRRIDEALKERGYRRY